jgi:hypothetical protein
LQKAVLKPFWGDAVAGVAGRPDNYKVAQGWVTELLTGQDGAECQI